MTLELIERIARLMHAEAIAFTRERAGRYRVYDDEYIYPSWDNLSDGMQDKYRHVARQVLRALGR